MPRCGTLKKRHAMSRCERNELTEREKKKLQKIGPTIELAIMGKKHEDNGANRLRSAQEGDENMKNRLPMVEKRPGQEKIITADRCWGE